MWALGVVYGAAVLMGQDPWHRTTLRKRPLERRLLLILTLALALQGAVLLLGAVLIWRA